MFNVTTYLRSLKVALTAAALSCLQVAAQADTLRMGTILPSMTSYSQVAQKWGEAVTEASGGALTVQFFPGGALGRDPRQQVELLRSGVLDIVIVPVVYEPGAFPDNEVVELPLLIGSQKKASHALWSLYQEGLLRGYDDLKALALFTTPVYNLHFSGPVTGPADLAGKRIRIGSPIHPPVVTGLGGVPVAGIGITETAQALSRGTIDGTFASWDAVWAFKFRQVSDTHVMLPLGFSSMMMAMTKERFEELDPAVQELINNTSGLPVIDAIIDASYGFVSNEITAAEEDPKSNVTYLEAEALEEYTDLIRPVVTNWVSTHDRGPELIDALERILLAQPDGESFASVTREEILSQ